MGKPSPTPLSRTRIEFPSNALLLSLCGPLDSHLKQMEERLAVSLHPLGNSITITAPEPQTKKVQQLLESLYAALEQGHAVDQQWVEKGILKLEEEAFRHTPLPDCPELAEFVLRTPRRVLYPRTPRQAEYLQALSTAALTFAIGPAGTGKTFLAVAVAITHWLEGRVARIILTRPAVEAGERLGFLPGDLQAKVDPYLRPLYDALHAMLGPEKVERMLMRNELEIAPLAYMRGRTLEEAFIILDEAQNTTTEQMKMFLTRFGEGSQAVVSGDITQMDLPKGQPSGLVQAAKILQNIPEVAFVHFTHRDVVRHPLVRKIVQAYEQAGQSRKTLSGKTDH
ncbi:MAG: PhoH family protein [Magnetococcales bacterium]|nr:PhoH family protein [Magnetococcales bacterium]